MSLIEKFDVYKVKVFPDQIWINTPLKKCYKAHLGSRAYFEKMTSEIHQ